MSETHQCARGQLSAGKDVFRREGRVLYGLARVRHLAERECAAGRGEGAHLARRARTESSFIEEKMSSAKLRSGRDPQPRPRASRHRDLRVEKVLIQLGLDPSHISYDAVFNRLVDVALANITFTNLLALTGATCCMSPP